MLKITDQLSIPLKEIQISFARSPGPGGQNVNKVNTKALLRWNVSDSPSISGEVRQRLVTQVGRRITRGGDILITSHRFRDQGRNVADCLNKLRELLLEAATRPTVRKITKKPRRAIRRRLENKQRQSAKKRTRGQISREE